MPWGRRPASGPPKRFRIDSRLAPLAPHELTEYGERGDGLMVADDLAGDARPSFGRLVRGQGASAAPGIDGGPRGAVQLDGQKGLLLYGLRAMPSRDYTVLLWVNCDREEDHLGQIFSAWDHAMDDPLRLSVKEGKLSARIEARGAWTSEEIAMKPGTWHHVAAVKSGPLLTLLVDGKRATSLPVPAEVYSSAKDFALGGNPHYGEKSEHLACRLARLAVYARALAEEEILAMYQAQRPK